MPGPDDASSQVLSAQFEVAVDEVVSSENSTSSLYSLSLRAPNGKRKVLLVNKRNAEKTVDVNACMDGASSTVWLIDATYTHAASPRVIQDVHTSITLGPFATAVLVQT